MRFHGGFAGEQLKAPGVAVGTLFLEIGQADISGPPMPAPLPFLQLLSRSLLDL